MRNKQIKKYVDNDIIMLTIIKNLMKEDEYIGMVLEQLLELK